MKIAMVAPDWGNSWIPLYTSILEKEGHEVRVVRPDKQSDFDADLGLHMWAAPSVNWYPRNIMFMRRYEFFTNEWKKFDWSKIETLIFCNEWIKANVEEFFQGNGLRTELIYNAVDTSRWTFKKRSHGNKIGMVCFVHPKKNIPLAIQIMSILPPEYELHIAGGIQDTCVADYLANYAYHKGIKMYFYNHIPREYLDEWWEDKSYCLSTSVSEGNPNNVLEAMAKGIKPVVHAWPGAESQFEKVFYTAADAAADILHGEYNSDSYFGQIKHNHSLTNYEKIVKLINQGGH